MLRQQPSKGCLGISGNSVTQSDRTAAQYSKGCLWIDGSGVTQNAQTTTQ